MAKNIDTYKKDGIPSKAVIVWATYVLAVSVLYVLSYCMVAGDKVSMYLSVPIVCLLPSIVLLISAVQVTRVILHGDYSWTIIIQYGIPFGSFPQDNIPWDINEQGNVTIPGTVAYLEEEERHKFYQEYEHPQ